MSIGMKRALSVLFVFNMMSYGVVVAAPPSASAGAPVYSLQVLVVDLQAKANTAGAELHAFSEAALKGAPKPEDLKRMAPFSAAMQEISQCLSLRAILAATIPSDPLYQARRNQRLAEQDLRMAELWWEYCRKDHQDLADGDFEKWPLAMKCRSNLGKATEELNALKGSAQNPEQAAKEKGSVIHLDSAISGALRPGKDRRAALLDQIDGWKDLPDGQKEKFIAR